MQGRGLSLKCNTVIFSFCCPGHIIQNEVTRHKTFTKPSPHDLLLPAGWRQPRETDDRWIIFYCPISYFVLRWKIFHCHISYFVLRSVPTRSQGGESVDILGTSLTIALTIALSGALLNMSLTPASTLTLTEALSSKCLLNRPPAELLLCQLV